MPSITGSFAGKVGPTIMVIVGVSPEREKVLRRVGFPVPEPRRICVLVDTGAEVSAFSPELFRHLQISALGQVPTLISSSRSGEPEYFDEYEVSIQMVFGNEVVAVGTFSAIAMDNWLAEEPYQGLVYRHFLESFTFVCDGPKKRFTLSR